MSGGFAHWWGTRGAALLGCVLLAVSAGLIDTPWWSFLDDEQRAAQYASFAENLPTKRVGQPHEVADAVRFLTTASYVTGQILPVDGGATVG